MNLKLYPDMLHLANQFPVLTTVSTKLLIVEDDYLIATDLQRILEKAGYIVTGLADSVEEALQIIGNVRPDIVLLDIFLKGEMTGIDLARTLKQRNIPFVFLTANSNQKVMEEVKKTEPYGFLVKPFRDKDVLSALEIARYRHAHSTEASLRQEQALQVAVNNALINIKDLDMLCKAIATEINRIVSFQAFDLRIRLNSEVTTFSTCLWKSKGGLFVPEEGMSSAALGRGKFEWTGKQTGVFVGNAFTELCEQYAPYRLVSRL